MFFIPVPATRSTASSHLTISEKECDGEREW